MPPLQGSDKLWLSSPKGAAYISVACKGYAYKSIRIQQERKIMPDNRNALIRYRTLDNCLRNRYRQWTLEDLIEACSEALYEYEGIDKGVSRRTVQMDLQMMRSDKLGYNAPIVVIDKKYYMYEDLEYSITNIPKKAYFSKHILL